MWVRRRRWNRTATEKRWRKHAESFVRIPDPEEFNASFRAGGPHERGGKKNRKGGGKHTDSLWSGLPKNDKCLYHSKEKEGGRKKPATREKNKKKDRAQFRRQESQPRQARKKKRSRLRRTDDGKSSKKMLGQKRGPCRVLGAEGGPLTTV